MSSKPRVSFKLSSNTIRILPSKKALKKQLAVSLTKDSLNTELARLSVSDCSKQAGIMKTSRNPRIDQEWSNILNLARSKSIESELE
jgi:hypothetical protein